ncbi:peptidyl-prolyl isomerase-1-like protein [Dinothrombium tinctorium]|uniref:Peptidyl-prolyl cis-trans isomerase n=1 Tax=Dinothrombium tinctorium TaxID=1965070 RepID=A0A3S3NWG3_9ACAR|nr:peptidyl-prolyl isomerase-1-like protein [Dinothrombium tinctorium]
MATTSSRQRCFLDIGVESSKLGRLVIELRSDVVPKTAENFRTLCSQKQYKNTTFSKIIPSFKMEAGEIRGYTGKLEEKIYTLKHTKNVVSMIGKGPMFCIVTSSAAAPELDNVQVAFGVVVDGFDVIKKIEVFGSPFGTPKKTVTIIDCGLI